MRRGPTVAEHEFCTADDCPCFASGIQSVSLSVVDAIHALNDAEQALQATLDSTTDHAPLPDRSGEKPLVQVGWISEHGKLRKTLPVDGPAGFWHPVYSSGSKAPGDET